ncbi:hypothetical protein BDR05DRAFT_278748 [Suillus weaverae]|nr:hypothetical protein BDR05DRAFT_278748 [Suillus weaverae]
MPSISARRALERAQYCHTPNLSIHYPWQLVFRNTLSSDASWTRTVQLSSRILVTILPIIDNWPRFSTSGFGDMTTTAPITGPLLDAGDGTKMTEKLASLCYGTCYIS